MTTTTQVEVLFVNPPKPGGKKGSIKTKDGAYYGVWADKLGEFMAGCTYEIEYEESQFQGKTYRNINTAKGVKKVETINGSDNTPMAAAARITAGVNNQFRNPEQMFVEAGMVALIETKQVSVNEDDFTAKGLMLQQVWQRLWGGQDE